MEKEREQQLLFGGSLKEKKLTDAKLKRLAHVFTDPIIVFRGAEADITDEIHHKIRIHRLKALMNADELTEEATDYEAMIYIMTTTFCQPPSNLWFNIYAYLFSKLYPGHAKEIGFDTERKLNIQENYELQRLKRWIFRRQAKARKEGMRKHEPNTTAESDTRETLDHRR